MFSVQCKKEGAHSDSIWSCDWGRVSVGDEPGTNPTVPDPTILLWESIVLSLGKFVPAYG
jgi:hypothetical protein